MTEAIFGADHDPSLTVAANCIHTSSASLKPKSAISLAVGAQVSAPKHGVSFLLIAINVQLKAEVRMHSSTTPLEVTYLRTTSLKPDPRNPRVHSDKQIR